MLFSGLPDDIFTSFFKENYLSLPGDNESRTEAFLKQWSNLRFLSRDWNRMVMLIAFHWYPNVTETTSPLILFTRNLSGWVRYYQPIVDWHMVTSAYEVVNKEKALQASRYKTHAVSWDSINGWRIGPVEYLSIEVGNFVLRRDFENGHSVLAKEPNEPDPGYYYLLQPTMLWKSTDPSGIALKQNLNCSKYHWAHMDVFTKWVEPDFLTLSHSCYAALHPDGTVKIVGDDERFFKIEFQTPDTVPRPAEVTPVHIEGRFSKNNNDTGQGYCRNDADCPCAKFPGYTGSHCSTIYYSINYDPMNQTVRIDSLNRLDVWFEIDLNRHADRFRVQQHLFHKAAADNRRERLCQLERERKEEEEEQKRRHEEFEQERKRKHEEAKKKQKRTRRKAQK